MKRSLPVFALLFGLSFALSAVAAGEVARAQFTTDVQSREPVDDVGKLGNTENKVYFFTELRNLDGQTVTHQWEYQDEVMAEVSFDVRGPRWRVWSSKQLLPAWTGEWTVAVVDQSGEVLAEESFRYVDSGE